MNVFVMLRQVPDAASELEIAESGREIDREWVDLRLNDFDDHALEQAVLLKEAAGAHVIAATADGDGAERLLRTAIARGADVAMKLACGDAPASDSRALASAVAEAAAASMADLVLAGVQTPDDVFGQLAPYVGALLGWPHVSAVSSVRVDDASIEVTQEHGAGISVELRVALPAVLGIQTATQAPRYVSGTKLRQAAAATLGVFAPTRAALDNTAEIIALRPPTQRGGTTLLAGTPAEIADAIMVVLRERGLLGQGGGQ